MHAGHSHLRSTMQSHSPLNKFPCLCPPAELKVGRQLSSLNSSQLWTTLFGFRPPPSAPSRVPYGWVAFTVDLDKLGTTVPPCYLALSREYGEEVYWDRRPEWFKKVVGVLGPHPIMRVGGNSQDALLQVCWVLLGSCASRPVFAVPWQLILTAIMHPASRAKLQHFPTRQSSCVMAA